ncbi:uncharacterized protein LOC135847455 [Planococcus citri]|uniref:uncharacterized protein LOC135847455 n=1 Tax=Planococcus citri TaxID=170843 RepID=UPI0031F790D6
MAENSKTVINIIENPQIDHQKNTKNGDCVPEAPHLGNGAIKEIPEEPESSLDEAEKEDGKVEENSNVAENEETPSPSTEDIEVRQDKPHSHIINEVIKEEIEVTETFLEEESESSKINQEAEEGDNEITRSFEVIQVKENFNDSKELKADEIITLQEVAILPLKEEPTRPSLSRAQQKSQLITWDIKKTVFFYFFLFAFVVWIVAYYAFDTGLIPNDKKK